tara:strand:- start:1430 stop:2008 length:579 start_codon:yes stop_codon:yes gene_type:complete
MSGPITFGYQNLGFGASAALLDPGRLQLIQTQSISLASTFSFDTLQEDVYSVHMMKVSGYQPQTDDRHLTIQFKVGGSTITATDYQYAMQENGTAASENKSANDSRIYLGYNCSVAADETTNGTIFIYNAGDSAKFTFLTSQFMMLDFNPYPQVNFSSGVYEVANVVNGLQFQTSGGNLEHGKFALYGIAGS